MAAVAAAAAVPVAKSGGPRNGAIPLRFPARNASWDPFRDYKGDQLMGKRSNPPPMRAPMSCWDKQAGPVSGPCPRLSIPGIQEMERPPLRPGGPKNPKSTSIVNSQIYVLIQMPNSHEYNDNINGLK